MPMLDLNYTDGNRYGTPRHQPPSRTHSAKVVVLLFGTLMLVQMLGFCFVIALRRRSLQNRATTEYSGTQISRGGGGFMMPVSLQLYLSPIMPRFTATAVGDVARV